MKDIDIVFKSEKIIGSDTTALDLINILMVNRGINDTDSLKFLNPVNPGSLQNTDFGIDGNELAKAVSRIRKAIDNKEKVMIYGDYDVDGITATAVLWQSLVRAGCLVVPFVPHREHDGYGVKYQSFINHSKKNNQKFDLLITVDNGIVAHEEIEKIQNEGVDVIVVDHHVASEKQLKVSACVHSTAVSGCVLSWLLSKQFDQEADLGLAALGAVADCMPLIGINRNIIVHGLQSLRLNPSFGIKKLIELSACKQDSLSAYDLGFILGPRINAVGRLSDPTDALRLLCSQNPSQAQKYASILNNYNKDRQNIQQESISLAEKMVTGQDKVIFVSDSSFHPGIIGLIAGRLTEKKYLPSIIISEGKEVSKGSCRSIKELNIIETLRETSDLMLDLGGHAQAAGFSIRTKNIEKFKKKIIKIINSKLKNETLKPVITVDARMELSAVTLANAVAVGKMSPFGLENPEPLFFFKDTRVASKRLLGSNQDHLKLRLDDTETSKKENIHAEAIAFKKGEYDKLINVGDKIDIIAKLEINTWQGVSLPQLQVKEIIVPN